MFHSDYSEMFVYLQLIDSKYSSTLKNKLCVTLCYLYTTGAQITLLRGNPYPLL